MEHIPPITTERRGATTAKKRLYPKLSENSARSKMLKYHRKEIPVGGNVKSLVELKEMMITIRMGRLRKTTFIHVNIFGTQPI